MFNIDILEILKGLSYRRKEELIYDLMKDEEFEEIIQETFNLETFVEIYRDEIIEILKGE